MKTNYDKNIALQCQTCGSESAFETDENTSVVTCRRCNRVYRGGYDELVELNQRRIDDEIQLTVNEVERDLTKEITKMFKNAFKN